ncbi:MAG: hypothetical protein Q7T04_08165 [Dehalococcoidia bacterium]|nr:hypothetical protein [Dehalococcoidia bacterium]
MVEHGLASQQLDMLVYCYLAKQLADLLLDLHQKKPFSPLCGKPDVETTIVARLHRSRPVAFQYPRLQPGVLATTAAQIAFET